MGSLPPQLEIAEIVTIERRAPARQVLDPRHRLGSHPFSRTMVDNAGPGHFGILRMGMGAVALPHRCRYPALRPGRGCPGAQRLGREHRHRPRRQLERGKQSRQPRSHDQRPIGIKRIVECGHGVLPPWRDTPHAPAAQAAPIKKAGHPEGQPAPRLGGGACIQAIQMPLSICAATCCWFSSLSEKKASRSPRLVWLLSSRCTQ
ncbi:hypothetical protein DEVEQU_03992 [Devosia equisanguinis]|uniref:Uncharacterized protein n=1 Tax=Devosia equisanguinis TaxID=2490941 RepID=A0A3S4D8G9_9HYPH|nr:hypothetical protein DEVEQU_03992 [Devosia equisanguinis]